MTDLGIQEGVEHFVPPPGSGAGDGFVRPFTPEEVRGFSKEWRKLYPLPDQPPLANVSLARALATALEARPYRFRRLRLISPPVSYLDGLELLDLQQQMETCEIPFDPEREHGERTDDEILDQVQALRDVYAKVAEISGRLITGWRGRNPFFASKPEEFHRTLSFLLDTGNELKGGPDRISPTSRPARYDAAHYLVLYVSRFGATPGMMAPEREGRPTIVQPASWRHFSIGMAMIRREEAERSLQMFDAIGALFSKEEHQSRWLDGMNHAAGLREAEPTTPAPVTEGRIDDGAPGTQG
jgi:hypothetical protein